jgi:type I restriction-modification system DNA methylase subunit
MVNYSLLADKVRTELLKSYSFEDKDILNEVVFVHLSEIILQKTYKDNVSKHGLYTNGKNVLKQVYPYIFENRLSTMYPIIEDLKTEIYSNLNGELARDAIGKLYEDCLSIDKRKDIGQFYTRSSAVIEYMLNTSQYSGEIMIDKRIIDPAVGSGLFLINAAMRLKEYMQSNGYSPKQILQHITDNYYATDLDPFACYLTELNMLIEVMDLAIQAYIQDNNYQMDKINIFVGDFTIVPNAIVPFTIEKNDLFEESTELNDIKSKNGKFKNGFDLVLSNPPYVTMYGRRSRNMTEEKRTYYNTNYDFVQIKNGNNKFNLIMFFIERAIRMTNDGQRICFIVDMSFFETAFRDLRKYILDTCIVESMTVNLKEFDGVASGQQVILLKKESNKELRDTNIVKWIEGYNEEVLEIRQANWYDPNNEYKFYKPLFGHEVNIISKIEKHPILYHYFPAKQLRTCCALTGRTEDFMATEEDYRNDTEDFIFPYLEGSKGFSYKFAPLSCSRYLKYDYDLQIKISDEFKEELTLLGVKNKKRVTIGDKECYLAPKIFIRQSAKELIATYTEDKYAANNSLYVLTNKDYSDKNKRFLKYVCALLNSNLLTFYAQKKRIIRMGNGKTPQIKISDLHEVRLFIDDRNFDRVVDLVDKVSYQDINSEVYQNISNELNQLIYDSYEITSAEVVFLEEEIKKAME